MTDKLNCGDHALPCAACKSIFVAVTRTRSDGSTFTAIRCFNCGNTGSVELTTHDAVVAWNERSES